MNRLLKNSLLLCVLTSLSATMFLVGHSSAAPDPEKKLQRIEARLEKGGQPLDAQQKEAIAIALSAGRNDDVAAILTAEQTEILENHENQGKNKANKDKKSKKSKKSQKPSRDATGESTTGIVLEELEVN